MAFTLFLWISAILILFSSKKNKTNQWCAFSILIFSLGTLKEFLYYDLPSLDMTHNGVQFPLVIRESTYSIMTAILYYLVLPCFVIFSLYFAKLFYNKSKHMSILIKSCVFIPSVILFLYFVPTKVVYYQHTSMRFWYVVTIYNFLYGMIMTLIMIFSTFSEKSPINKRQNRFISLIILPPIWYWLITIFLIHSLKITILYKVWKDNIFILGLSIFAYIGLACTEGIMGLRLQLNHYHWDSEMRVASKGMNYTVHMLKNQINKIEWCVKNFNNSEDYNEVEEIKIIDRSVSYIKDFIQKTQLYAGDIKLDLRKCSITDIINNAVNMFKNTKDSEIQIDFQAKAKVELLCDSIHLTEVFYNFISNAAEAMNYYGNITIQINCNDKKKICITISDQGCGIPRRNISKLFNPYFTTKDTNYHFGLGLSYCYNVIKKHKGYIHVNSNEGKGTDFLIYLPLY